MARLVQDIYTQLHLLSSYSLFQWQEKLSITHAP